MLKESEDRRHEGGATIIARGYKKAAPWGG